MKKNRFIYLILPVITLILELLPYGAALNFGYQKEDGTIGTIRRTYSYFSLTPFGYANFAPLITAIFTCIILLLLVLFCITGRERFAEIARNLMYVSVVFSLGPLVFGIRYFSVVGGLITATILAELFLFSRKPVQSPENISE